MHPKTVSFLIDLNRQFYQNFGRAFAATRRRIQPGVRRALAGIPHEGDWLDTGCGSGSLALEWARQWRRGLYWGLDFSPILLEEARRATADLDWPRLTVRFDQADLSDPNWPAVLQGHTFDGALAFAVLHHIPGADLRRQILSQVRSLLKLGGQFIHSEWQFQNSPRIMARRLPWQKVGLDDSELEEGDTLLDWRYTLPGQAEEIGLRYVHLFDHAELAQLAGETGFEIVDEWHTDGEGGQQGLYQVWEKG